MLVDLQKVSENALNESVQSLLKGIPAIPDDKMRSDANVSKALMTYSLTLLEEYHKALQAELAKKGIEI